MIFFLLLKPTVCYFIFSFPAISIFSFCVALYFSQPLTDFQLLTGSNGLQDLAAIESIRADRHSKFSLSI